ncbi:MAG: hypothetical protein IAA89_04145 [Firmicutes bacterium]|uniref:Uncharacterized protein n=1 Tax=Candidatus Gallilactobacillus intestinavium TaxID=2840838 RepID=A0A9D9E5B1_9LACO|nr:hypothetical protein [Candidatus Gallilactobacillus intestinavium]
MINNDLNPDSLPDEFYERLLKDLKSRNQGTPDSSEMTDDEFNIFLIEDYLQSRHQKDLDKSSISLEDFINNNFKEDKDNEE